MGCDLCPAINPTMGLFPCREMDQTRFDFDPDADDEDDDDDAEDDDAEDDDAEDDDAEEDDDEKPPP